MLNRYLRAFGLYPFLGYLLIILLFIGASIYIFLKTEFAAYIYVFFGLSPLSLLSERRRNDFLKSCFPQTIYWRVRILENLLCILPFLLFLGYQQKYLFVICLIVIAIIMARYNFNNQLNYTIPTPFYHYPFEFTVGFRNTAIGCLFTYFLTYMGIAVGNFNLGMFALLVVFLICYSYYSQPDSNYYVWIYSMKARLFLFYKIKTGILYSTVLSLPISLSLALYFPEKSSLIFLFQILGYLYLVTVILAKYTAFPKAMNLPQVIFIIGSVFFPPFLLFVIPFFYKKSIQQLNTVLA